MVWSGLHLIHKKTVTCDSPIAKKIKTNILKFCYAFFFISPGKHVRHMVTLHTEALQALEAMWTTWHHAVNSESSTEAASIQRV